MRMIVLQSAFVISFLMMFVLYKYVRIKSLMDFPNDRKIHKKIIPLYGGLVFVGLFLLYSFFFLKESFFSPFFLLYLGGVLIFILGICDDVFKLNWKYKLSIQLIILLFCVGLIDSFSFFGFEFSSFFAQLLFVFWFLGITNAMNLLDGLDGLAVGVFALFLIAVLVLVNQYYVLNHASHILMLLLACIIPFLGFNFYPAKLYMGSAGSLFLGYFLAVLPLFVMFNVDNNVKAVYDFSFFIWIYAYIIFDTIRVLFFRVTKKKNHKQL